MPLFDREEKKIHFIHIPRTGGRYISKLFLENNFITSHDDVENISFFNDIFTMHLYYPLYKYAFSDYDERYEFCVVRNPLNKFISSITQMNNIHSVDYNFILNSQHDFNNFVLSEQCNDSKKNSWFLEQYKFISEKTKVWKYEYGFGKNFLRWIYENFDIKLTTLPPRSNYNKNIWTNYNEDFFNKKYKFKDMRLLKKYIKSFYKHDYKYFNY